MTARGVTLKRGAAVRRLRRLTPGFFAQKKVHNALLHPHTRPNRLCARRVVTQFLPRFVLKKNKTLTRAPGSPPSETRANSVGPRFRQGT